MDGLFEEHPKTIFGQVCDLRFKGSTIIVTFPYHIVQLNTTINPSKVS